MSAGACWFATLVYHLHPKQISRGQSSYICSFKQPLPTLVYLLTYTGALSWSIISISTYSKMFGCHIHSYTINWTIFLLTVCTKKHNKDETNSHRSRESCQLYESDKTLNTCNITCNFHFILRINIERLSYIVKYGEVYGGQSQSIIDKWINTKYTLIDTKHLKQNITCIEIIINNEWYNVLTRKNMYFSI